MDNDNIKVSFQRVKEDILFLGNEIAQLKIDTKELNSAFYGLSGSVNSISSEISEIKNMLNSFHDTLNSKIMEKISDSSLQQTIQQTNQHINTTNPAYPTQNPTVPQEIGGLITQNTDISTGNRGVPTNQQTNIQTIQPAIQQTDKYNEKSIFRKDFNYSDVNIEVNIKKASEILDSLDRIKKEIRSKFKRLTSQEMAVFSSIYQLEEQDRENTTYRQIAKNLRLSESSIRDYVQKIISKGIPIKKQKIDNKLVLLSVSDELKRIATLQTIIQLRDL